MVNPNKMRHRVRFRSLIAMVLVALLVVGPYQGVLATPGAPPADTVIPNRATATYTDGTTGLSFTLQSNEVKVRVQPLEALTLTQDQEILRPPGSYAVLTHRLTNTGNVRACFTLSVSNVVGDDFDLSNLTVVHDANGNGLVCNTDPVLASAAGDGPAITAAGSTISLEPLAGLDLVVQGNVPGSATAGQSARVQVRAQSTVQGATAQNEDVISVVAGASLTLTKTSSRVNAEPGDTVDFSVTSTNVGAQTAQGLPYAVDGANRNLVLVADPLPANTILVSATGTGGNGEVLYHLLGEAATVWHAGLPANLAQVDQVAHAFASIPPGASAVLNLRLRLSDNAAGDIKNVALAEFHDPTVGGRVRQASNPVVVNAGSPKPSISYYADDTFTNPTGATRLGAPLYVQVNSAACNQDPQLAEEIDVTLSSGKTGDVETFQATETGPNTGLFRILPDVPTADGSGGPIPGDHILQTVEQDTILAREECSGFAVTADILIDPFGVVFDSRTNAAVQGATVSILDVTGAGNGGNAGGPAVVFQDDGVTPAPAVVVTGADGAYRFPLVPPSTYRIVVQPPVGYGFPSGLNPAVLPIGRTVDPAGSYGGTFVVALTSSAIQLDIPVDGPPPSGLFVQKNANRMLVELGEFLEYTVTVANGSGNALTAVSLSDVLPAGFRYVNGTARVNGAQVADPSGTPGPQLEFNLGPMAPGGKNTVVYRVKVGPGVTPGYRDNLAQATASVLGGTIRSNVASARVRVELGVFNDRGVVIGRVYVDLNGSGKPDPDEPGIPLVRLFLEDGSFVLTDENGKYNLYGLRAQTHVLRVDKMTLPPGAKMGVTSQRQGGDAYSRFVDLKRQELHRADFAEVSGSPEVLAAIEARAKTPGLLEGTGALDQRLNPDGTAAGRPDSRTLPSQGMIGPSGPVPMEATPPRGQGLDQRNSNLPNPPVAAAPAPTALQQAAEIANMTPDLAFVDLQDGDTLAAPQANVRVKGMLGTKLRLTVNGEAVPESRVGQKSSVEDKQLQVWEYVGVGFRQGENEVVLDQVDAFGNVRSTVKLKLSAPGRPGALKLVLPEKAPPADGKTPAMIAVQVVDEQGLQVSARTPITLESDAGRWDVEDANPSEPGIQTFVTGGRTEFALLPPVEPGAARVRVSSGRMEHKAELVFTADVRPFVMTGVIDAAVDFRKSDMGSFRPDEIGNLVEDELDRLSQPDDASSRADLRGGFYAKGHLGNGYVLTAAYDSQKERDMQLFRDIRPDEYYPIFGDGSVKGFDAQSTSPLYFRVDRERNHLLFGDYVTATPDRNQGLGTYYRSLTGGKLHLEGDGYQANLFGSRERQRQVVQELPANGTSGPYQLAFRYPQVNSERVEIVTRDRNQPSVVLKSEARTRFTDYVVDFQTGGVLFRRPIPSLDENLNPIFVRVVYEVDGGGAASWVYGGDLRFRVADGLFLGGTYASEEEAQDPFRLWSANLGLDLTDRTHFTAEVAGTSRKSLGQGTANRFELVHEGDTFAARAFTGRTDTTFDNPTSILARGRTESGLKATWDVNDGTRLLGEFVRSKDNSSGGLLTGYQFGLEQQLTDGVNLELAYRRALQKDGVAQLANLGVPVNAVDLSTLRARLSAQLPDMPEAAVFLEYEQDVRDSSKRALALGGDYQFSQRGRVYARHEVLSSLGNRYTLNNVQRNNVTALGVDMDYMEGGSLFSEYRVRDAISGRENEAAVGLRNAFQVTEGLRLNTSYERIVGSPGGQSGQAVTGAFEWTGSPDLKATGRLELRTQSGQSYMLRTFGAAWRMSPDLSLLLRDVGDTTLGSGNTRRFDRTQLGMAYRPREGGPWNGLLKLERRYEQDDLASRLRRNVGLVSLAVNYQDPVAPLGFGAYYAGKYATEDSSGIASSSSAHMIGGRMVYELSQKWDMGLHGAKFFDNQGADQHTLGMEFGYMLRRDMWLSAGYNFVGFEDRDLSVENYTSQGPYIRMRFKFGFDDFGSEETAP